jgi:hypothetical protein
MNEQGDHALLARAELALGDGRYEDAAADAHALLEARPPDEVAIQRAKHLFAQASAAAAHDRGWSLRVAGGNRAVLALLDDPRRIRIQILALVSSDNYDVQLNRASYAVSAGSTYRLTFSARADAQRDVCAGFSKSAAPWSGLGLYRTLTLSTEWAEYSEDFVATSDDDRGRVHFDLGDAQSAVELATVLLWHVTDTGGVVLSTSPLRNRRTELALHAPGAEPTGAASGETAPATGDSSWVVSLPNPRHARTLDGFRMFAVLGTWMEADVVAATIRNAITQGCERVYLIDNGSTDGTVDVARREGAIVARTFRTDRYDETLRLRHMNDVVTDVSQQEADQHIWWLFLDADEFPHGPRGLTIREYLATLDQQFRIVGTRFFNHYPSGAPHYEPGRHPLDVQPLCEELAFPMCPSGHRKHPLQRFDRGGAPIECGNGFHGAVCSEQLYEPSQAAFLHHFPFRDEGLTRRRLEALWATADTGVSRALESHDTHMLTRFHSLDAVYAQNWAKVENFVALDPVNATVKAPASGVNPKPWSEMVEPEHQPIARWYSPRMLGAWKYEELDRFHYGDDVTYEKGMAFLDGHGTIEDWGCGFGHARQFVRKSRYVGVDGSAKSADKIADLREYASDADCIFMRHVLEHNVDWKRILENAVASFRRRMALIIFTPFSESTRVIRTTATVTSVPVPDISFRKADLTEHFANLKCREEAVATDTEYGLEHVFYIEK